MTSKRERLKIMLEIQLACIIVMEVLPKIKIRYFESLSRKKSVTSRHFRERGNI